MTTRAPLAPTAAPSASELDAVASFEAALAALGEADARLENLAALVTAAG